MGNQVGGAARATVAFVTVIVAVGATVGVFSLIPGSNSTSIGVTSTTGQSSMVASTTNAASSVSSSTNGLRLMLDVSQTVLPSGNGLSVNVSVFNTLTTRYNSTGTSLAWQDRLNLGPCPSNLPLGFGIFRGDYGAGNLSDGTPLGLFYPGVYSCPAGLEVAYWSFAPQTDNLTIVAQGGNMTLPSQQAGSDEEFWGYWSGIAPAGYASGNASFTSFHTGVYTVAAEDAWGQTAIRHFKVVAQARALTCATVASNPDLVALSNETKGPGPVRLEAYYQQLGGNDTYLLALSGNGSSPATLTFFNYAEIVQEGGLHELNAPLFFSPDPNQPQSWLYFTQNGTLAYPATFYPGRCTLVRIVLPPHSSSEIPLSLQFSDNETQQLTLEP